MELIPGLAGIQRSNLVVGAILMRRKLPEEECKGFNKWILEEKEGFENSRVPQHPTQLS